jgi:hypothetical protein
VAVQRYVCSADLIAWDWIHLTSGYLIVHHRWWGAHWQGLGARADLLAALAALIGVLLFDTLPASRQARPGRRALAVAGLGFTCMGEAPRRRGADDEGPPGGSTREHRVDVSGLGIVAVGLVLCFLGARSIHIAVLASGFALGWLLADAFNATPLASLAFGAVAALAAWALARVIFGLGLYIVGALAGAVVGAKLFAFLQQGQGSVVLAVLFVAATGFVAGVTTHRFRGTVLAAACALGGAGLVLSGLARAIPQVFGFLRTPQTPGMAAIAALAWIVLAVLGWAVQRRSATSSGRPSR